MEKSKTQGFTVEDLEIQKLALEDRIKRIETDLKCPLTANLDEQALEASQFLFMRRLLEVERSNLIKTNFEIDKKKQQLSAEYERQLRN